jgi:hypothetical protein
MPLEMTEGNYSNVGHRGPVYKGLGAMNPCDNLHLPVILKMAANFVVAGDLKLLCTRDILGQIQGRVNSGNAR